MSLPRGWHRGHFAGLKADGGPGGVLTAYRVLPLYSMIGLRVGFDVPSNGAVVANRGLVWSSVGRVGWLPRWRRPGMEVMRDAQSGATSRRRGVAAAQIASGAEAGWPG